MNVNHWIEMPPAASSSGGNNLNKFCGEVKSFEDNLKELEGIRLDLQASHKRSKTLPNANAVKALQSRLQGVALALNKAKSLRGRLESLETFNSAKRTSLVNSLRGKLEDSLNNFNALRQRISSEYREAVQCSYYVVYGQDPNEETLDRLISTGESETFLHKAILAKERPTRQVMNLIQERHDAVKDMETDLHDLHKVFSDMAVSVEAQEEQLATIEDAITRANSLVGDGNKQLDKARSDQKNTRKWTCIAIILLPLVVLALVFILIHKHNNNGTISTTPPPPPIFFFSQLPPPTRPCFFGQLSPPTRP